MELDYTHLINEKDELIIFDKRNLSIKVLNKQAVTKDSKETMKQLFISPKHQKILENSCKRTLDPNYNYEFSPIDGNEYKEKKLELKRLTLVVTNYCNLSCTYCYAGKGIYYSRRDSAMPRNIALNAINKVLETYSSIGLINFFGGEPTLNYDSIEMICEYLNFIHMEGKIKKMPRLGITTNGYFLSERMLHLLIKHGFDITLSIDGPKEIHDLNRKTKMGRGSYDSILRNINRINDNGINLEFECTYSADHLKLGYSVKDMMDFFYDQFGCEILHCPIIAISPASDKYIPVELSTELLSEAIIYSINNFISGDKKILSNAARLLNIFLRKTPILNYCPAGKDEITINVDGYIFTCFMLMKNISYNFGRISDMADRNRMHCRNSSEFSQNSIIRDSITKLIQESDKSSNAQCQRCWAQPMCYGCLGEELQWFGWDILRSSQPGKSRICDHKRAILDCFLRNIVRLKNTDSIH